MSIIPRWLSYWAIVHGHRQRCMPLCPQQAICSPVPCAATQHAMNNVSVPRPLKAHYKHMLKPSWPYFGMSKLSGCGWHQPVISPCIIMIADPLWLLTILHCHMKALAPHTRSRSKQEAPVGQTCGRRENCATPIAALLTAAATAPSAASGGCPARPPAAATQLAAGPMHGQYAVAGTAQPGAANNPHSRLVVVHLCVADVLCKHSMASVVEQARMLPICSSLQLSCN